MDVAWASRREFGRRHPGAAPGSGPATAVPTGGRVTTGVRLPAMMMIRRRGCVATMDRSDGVDTKKVTSILALVFVAFFIIQSPADAASIARSIGNGIGHVFDGLSKFLKQLN